MPYVSITGLSLRSPLLYPVFSWYAVRAFGEARRSPGNLSVEARRVAGVHHTLSVWESEAAMRAFLPMPAHKAAMRAFPLIATGRTMGFQTDRIPSWDEALEIWARDAKDYSGKGSA